MLLRLTVYFNIVIDIKLFPWGYIGYACLFTNYFDYYDKQYNT
jgi:hypothetical protein